MPSYPSSVLAPQLGSLPPPDWAPQTPAARQRYALGLELLLTSPIALAAVSSRPSRKAVNDPLWAIWSAPASALWSAMDKNQWRSLCCQAMDLSDPQLATALERVINTRLNDCACSLDWEKACGSPLATSHHLPRSSARGLAYAGEARLSVLVQLSPEQQQELLLKALSVPREWFNAGWIESVPQSEFNAWSWTRSGELSPFAQRCQARCHASAWEARELNDHVAAGSALLKRRNAL